MQSHETREQKTLTIGSGLCLAAGVWALGGFLIAVAVSVGLLAGGIVDGLFGTVLVIGVVLGVVQVARGRRTGRVCE
ncbi:hypothetical protein [Nocardioides sp.]|uniref:hypothetical protein n=1 Tax=Nocardioides sp. TaxID=35761 RepID=UPI003564AA9A